MQILFSIFKSKLIIFYSLQSKLIIQLFYNSLIQKQIPKKPTKSKQVNK